MAKVKDMSEEDLAHFVETKLLEILGDPDSGLALREEFGRKRRERLNRPGTRVSHEEVLKRLVALR